MTPDNNLTDDEKRAQCERICGDGGKKDMHRMAPDMCPILWDIWRQRSSLQGRKP